MLISLYSPKGSYDANFLINYCGINLRDQLLRIPGIAQVDLFGGTDYGMRIWLRARQAGQARRSRRADVISAIKEQNLQAPAGRIGAAPSPKDQEFTYTVSAPGRLVNAEEFENIIIRETATGAQIRVKDVGRAELGSQDYNSFGRLDGKPAGTMAVYLLPGANQLKASEAIYETMRAGEGAVPAGHGLQDRLRHDAGGQGLDRRRSSTPSSRRSSWSRWWCSSSCRTCGRRSSRSSPCPCR